MNKTTKTLFAFAAIAGLTAGSLATKAHAEDAGKPAQQAEHKDGDKNSCKSKEGCKAKDSCKAKEGCKSKDGCHAKDGAKADNKADGHQDGEQKTSK